MAEIRDASGLAGGNPACGDSLMEEKTAGGRADSGLPVQADEGSFAGNGKKQEKEAGKSFSTLGLGAAVILLVGSCLQLLTARLLPGLLDSDWGIWIVDFVPLYVIAVPLGLMIMRRVPAAEQREGERFGPGSWLIAAVISVFLMYAGNLVGIMITSIFGSLLGHDVINPVESLAMDGMLSLKILVVVILGPLIEELIFRKTLIDRMRPYGEKTAVLTSAAMFGLFHGNFSQLFYAFALGLVFGYVYIRSGKLRYSALLHMLINFTGSILAPAMLSGVDADILGSMDTMNSDALMELITPGFLAFVFYILLMLLLAFAGLVLLRVFARRIHFLPSEKELERGRRFQLVCCNPGMLLLLACCIAMIVVNLLFA